MAGMRDKSAPRVWTIGAVVVMFALVFLAAPSRSSAAGPVLGFGGYGALRIGDSPAEVNRALGTSLECNDLGGGCVCASLGEGLSSLTFVYRLDRQSGLDVIFTSSPDVAVARGLRVGDSIARMKNLFPHAHESGSVGYPGYKRFLVSHGALGIQASVHRGRIEGFLVGKKRFFDYEEFCA
jgi:hypothetical protein